MYYRMGSLSRSITSSLSSLLLMQLDSSFPIVRQCKPGNVDERADAS